MKIGNIEVYGIIYKIANTINNKVYIGQTINGFKKRYKYKGIGIERVYNHCLAYEKNNKHYNKRLFNAIEKYGFDCWDIVEIYDIAFSKEELDIKEKCYIQLFDSFHNGYNQTLGGDGNQGYIPNEETRNKLSKAWWNKSDKEKEEINKKISIALSGENNPMYGKNSWDYMTEETKEKKKKKLRERMIGKNNPNYGKDMSGKNNPNYGKHLSEETKRKISENHADFSGKNHPQAKAIICLTTKKIFFTVSEGAEYYGIKNSSNIVRCCQGELKSAGKSEDKIKLVWKYLKDFLEKCVYEIL